MARPHYPDSYLSKCRYRSAKPFFPFPARGGGCLTGPLPAVARATAQGSLTAPRLMLPLTVAFVSKPSLERDFIPDNNVGDIFNANSWRNTRLGYSIHCRSDTFATGSQFGRIEDGSNYATFYLQHHL